jgi:hypothetical protein
MVERVFSLIKIDRLFEKNDNIESITVQNLLLNISLHRSIEDILLVRIIYGKYFSNKQRIASKIFFQKKKKNIASVCLKKYYFEC